MIKIPENTVIDIDFVKQLDAITTAINSVDLSKAKIMYSGRDYFVSPDAIEEHLLTGKDNMSFIMSGGYKKYENNTLTVKLGNDLPAGESIWTELGPSLSWRNDIDFAESRLVGSKFITTLMTGTEVYVDGVLETSAGINAVTVCFDRIIRKGSIIKIVQGRKVKWATDNGVKFGKEE